MSHQRFLSTRAFVATFHPRFREEAIREIKAVDTAACITPLDDGAVHVAQATRASALADAFVEDRPVFVGHLAPVHATVQVEGLATDPARIASTAVRALPWQHVASLMVECRKAGRAVSGTHADATYTCRDVEVAVGTALEERGACIEMHVPASVVHIYLVDDRAHLGIADVMQTIRPFADPLTRAQKLRTVRVTRAEHKLIEAFDVFGIATRPGMRALDLGAAPGGWSLVLAERGVEVTAVDPAALDERAAAHPLIRHVRERAERVGWATEGAFDLVVNDTALDPDDSARVMVAVASRAPRGTDAVMTLKLPTRNVQRWTAAAQHLLTGNWTLVSARHLAANRQEVTWHLCRD